MSVLCKLKPKKINIYFLDSFFQGLHIDSVVWESIQDFGVSLPVKTTEQLHVWNS